MNSQKNLSVRNSIISKNTNNNKGFNNNSNINSNLNSRSKTPPPTISKQENSPEFKEKMKGVGISNVNKPEGSPQSKMRNANNTSPINNKQNNSNSKSNLNFDQVSEILNQIQNVITSLANIWGLDQETMNLIFNAAQNSTYLNQPPANGLTLIQTLDAYKREITNLREENEILKNDNRNLNEKFENFKEEADQHFQDIWIKFNEINQNEPQYASQNMEVEDGS